MAFLAFPLFSEASMRPLLGVDVLPHLFVTIEAKTGLRWFVESLVALRAVLFPFGMPCDHLARHESGFNIIGPGMTRRECP